MACSFEDIIRCDKVQRSSNFSRFIFTTNNYSDEIFLSIVEFIKEFAKIACGQYEIAPTTHTPHIQWYILSKKLHTKNKMIQITRNLHTHVDVCRGSPKQVHAYCTKTDTRDMSKNDGQPFFYPNKELCYQYALLDSAHATKSLKLNQLVDVVVSGKRPYDDSKYILHHEKIDRIAKHKKYDAILALHRLCDFHPFPWQEECIKLLDIQTDRQVLWIFDQEGNTGKTTMAKYFMSNHNYLMCDSKTTNHDLAEMVTDRDPVGCVYNLPRESRNEETGAIMVSWKSIESLKDNFLFSSKYHGCSILLKPPNVVFKICIFANFPPDLSKMSKDRWCVYQIVLNKLTKWF